MIKMEATNYAFQILDSTKSAQATMRAIRRKYPNVDEDTVYEVFQGAFEKWSRQEAPRYMAERRSEASRRASRENGKKGGRPKKEMV